MIPADKRTDYWLQVTTVKLRVEMVIDDLIVDMPDKMKQRMSILEKTQINPAEYLSQEFKRDDEPALLQCLLMAKTALAQAARTFNKSKPVLNLKQQREDKY